MCMIDFKNEDFSILIVDDNPKNLQVLGGILRPLKYRVEFAMNGHQALAWVARKGFDLVLLDVQMPEIQGYEVCEKIRKMSDYDDTPVIFLTGQTENEAKVRGFEAGAQDYITKPFDTNELLARVRTHLQLKHSKTLLKQTNVWLEKEVAARTEELIARQAETEKVRMRISQDIHDDISSQLNKISWMSELVKIKAKQYSAEELNAALDKIIRASRESVDNLIEIIWSLNPVNDNLGSLLAYMRNYINRFLNDTSFNINIDFQEQDNIVVMNPELKRNLFLVMKEALHNAVKYSKANNITVQFTLEADEYCLRISDDGVGITEGVVLGTGNGMINMKKRAEHVMGRFTVDSGPGRGTTIRMEGKIY